MVGTAELTVERCAEAGVAGCAAIVSLEFFSMSSTANAAQCVQTLDQSKLKQAHKHVRRSVKARLLLRTR